ncbi:MAG: hypothetical protein QOF85_2561 [Solirubrobacterales bacterium]|jgi:hypothetical protein|nr:hypothetical protein [Solirubrobacterales bacterium]
MVAWNPQVGDLAAQVFRAELFQHAGLSIWNGSWYGGHYTLTYSFLFPPLASLLGVQLVGVLSVVASSFFFDRLVRDRWGAPARWATLWFAAGVVTLLADGQLTFALGIAFSLASLRCLQLGRARLALGAAAACALSSPVAAAFLAGVVLIGALERGRPLNRIAVWIAAIALGLIVVPNLAFPESGQFPFAFSSFVAIPLWCGSALYVTRGLRGEERQLRWAIAAYLIASLLVWLVPNPMGGNAVRLGALFGGPVLAAAVLARRPRVSPWFLALFLAGGLYWQVTASVSQIVRSVGDPSTSRSYFLPASHWLSAHGGHGVRVEVPPTANHWESAYLATNFELARGWLRQLDTTRDDVFYADSPLTAAAYQDWLHRNAISYVALPDARLDYSSEAERRLILRQPSYLDLRWTSPHWRIYAVRDPEPLVDAMGSATARTLWVGRQGFGLDVSHPGDFLVRVNFTPYWSIDRGAGCLLRRGDWTVARASHPGILRVSADFSLGRAWNAVTGAKKTC